MAVKAHTIMAGPKAGEKGLCRATLRECPNGSDAEHVYLSSEEEIEEYNELLLAKEHGEIAPRQLKRLGELNTTSKKLYEYGVVEKALEDYVEYADEDEKTVTLSASADEVFYTAHLTIDPDNPIGSTVDQLRDFDADEVFASHMENSGGEYQTWNSWNYDTLMGIRKREKEFSDIADKLEGSSPSWVEDEYAYEGDMDEIPEVGKEMTRERLEEFLEEADLHYGNAEVGFEPAFIHPDNPRYNVSERKYISVEGPNNGTMMIELEDAKTMGEAYEKVVEGMRRFDAAQEFDELWSPSFGDRNHLFPITFAKMLEEDKAWFEGAADKLEGKLAERRL